MRWEAWSAGAAAAAGYPDCELVVTGLIAQPATAWTSLAFIPIGIWVATDRRIWWPGRVLLAASLIAVGTGSFLGHAAATDWGRQLDSLAIKLLLITFVVYPLASRLSWSPAVLGGVWLAVAASVAAMQLIVPGAANPLLVLLAAGALILAGSAAYNHTRPWLLGGVGLLGAGALLWWLGRDGGPLCAADASLQPHGLWHILAAAGIACIYQVHRSETL